MLDTLSKQLMQIVIDNKKSWDDFRGKENAANLSPSLNIHEEGISIANLGGAQDQRFFAQATYESIALDSSIEECSWHRLVLDMNLPVNTRVEISIAASNDKDFKGRNWANPVAINAGELLTHKSTGRYFKFKLDLYSDDLHTHAPLIRSIKIEYPRQSCLEYLPQLYRDNEQKSDLLSRLMAMFASITDVIDNQIDNTIKLFDADAALVEHLSWLKQWLAISGDENWPDDKLRELIKAAPSLYKMRGTARGLKEILKLYAGLDDTSINICEYLNESIIMSIPLINVVFYSGKHYLVVDVDGINTNVLTVKDRLAIICDEIYENVEIKSINPLPQEKRLVVEITEPLTHEAEIAEYIKSFNENNAGIESPKVIKVSDLADETWRFLSIRKEFRPYSFFVRLKCEQNKFSDSDKQALKRIVDSEKPAHTIAHLLIETDEAETDAANMVKLGQNTIIGEDYFRLN